MPAKGIGISPYITTKKKVEDSQIQNLFSQLTQH